MTDWMEPTLDDRVRLLVAARRSVLIDAVHDDLMYDDNVVARAEVPTWTTSELIEYVLRNGVHVDGVPDG